MARLVVAAAMIITSLGWQASGTEAASYTSLGGAATDISVKVETQASALLSDDVAVTVSLVNATSTYSIATYSFRVTYGAASFTYKTAKLFDGNAQTPDASTSGEILLKGTSQTIGKGSTKVAILTFTPKVVSATATFDLKAGGTVDLVSTTGAANPDQFTVSSSTPANIQITDATTPRIKSITRSAAAGTSTFDFTAAFTVPVVGVASTSFTINTGAGIDKTAGTPFLKPAATAHPNDSGAVASDGATAYTTWTFTVELNGATGNDSDTSTIGLALKSSGTGIKSAAPSSIAVSSNTAPSSGTSETYRLDNTVPTVKSISNGSASANQLISASSSTPTFTVTFSEAMKEGTVDASDFELAITDGSNVSGFTGSYLSVSPSTGESAKFTVTVANGSAWATGLNGDGTSSATFRLRLASTAPGSGPAADRVGNPISYTNGSGATSTYGFTLDTKAPSAGVLVANGKEGSIVLSKTPTFSLTDAYDLSLGNDNLTDKLGKATLASIQLQYATSSGGTYSNIGSAISPTATSTYTLTVPTSTLSDGEYYFKAKVTDLAGNTSLTSAERIVIATDGPVGVLDFVQVASGSATANAAAFDALTWSGATAKGYARSGYDLVARLRLVSAAGLASSTGTATFEVATGTFDFAGHNTSATATFNVPQSPNWSAQSLNANGTATQTYYLRIGVPSALDVNQGGSVTVKLDGVTVTDNAGATSKTKSVNGVFYVDNIAPTFTAPSPVGGVYYADDTLRTAFVFSEAVTGATQASFTSAPGSAAITGTPVLNVSPGCSNTITVDVSGIKGTGEASSTFAVLLNATGTNITDCAGNALADRSSVATASFVLYPGNRPTGSSGSSGGGSSDGGSSGGSSSPSTSTKPAAVSAPVAPPAPAGFTSNGAVAQAYSALAPAKAQALVNGLGLVSPATVASLGATLGAVGGPTAAAFLDKLAGLPPVYLASVANVTAAIPAQAAGALISALSTLSPAQMAAVGELSAVLQPAEAAKVFGSIASLAQSGNVAFAPAPKLEKSPTGVDTMVFDLEDAGAVASDIDDSEVAGVQAATAQRTVVVLLKAGQVGRVNRPKSGNWPNLAVPVTAGKQVGLTPIFSLPADASAFTFEPTPGNLNVVQQGSLGGGNVTPLSAPFAVTVSASAGSKATVGVQMPSLPVGDGNTFAYLYSTGGGTGAGFAGYLRAPAEFDPPTGRQVWKMSVGEASDVLILPVSLSPAYVQNFSETARIYSSSEDSAADFGAAGPQYTTFTVVAPQVRGRIYVYNPVTAGYGWINATEVGPSGAPKS